MKTNNDLIVVKYASSEDEEFFITYKENFENVRFCECYDDYGQKNGCYNAGCYSIDNSESEAKNECIEALYKHLGVEFTEDDCNDISFDEAIEGTNDLLSNINLEEIEKFVEKWKVENEIHTEVTAWTYWDGRNFKTALLDFLYGDGVGYETVESELQSEILAEMPETPNFNGVETIIDSDNYQFTYTKWTSDPWICKVTPK